MPSKPLTLKELIEAENFSLDLTHVNKSHLTDLLMPLLRYDVCLCLQFIALKTKKIRVTVDGPSVISYGWKYLDNPNRHGLYCEFGLVSVPLDQLYSCKTPEEMLTLFETEYAIQRIQS